MSNLKINRIKNSLRYEFECNMCEEFKTYDIYDEWGCAYIFFKGYGAEYNFCMQSDGNYSAIYPMICENYDESWETDYDFYEHYEIDFDNPNWEKELEKHMCQLMIDYFGYDNIM